MEREALAQVRARLERVLEELVDDGRVWLERPRVVEDLRGLLAEIDRRPGAALGRRGGRRSREATVGWQRLLSSSPTLS
jgi:hypothetical protein